METCCFSESFQGRQGSACDAEGPKRFTIGPLPVLPPGVGQLPIQDTWSPHSQSTPNKGLRFSLSPWWQTVSAPGADSSMEQRGWENSESFTSKLFRP